MKMRPLIRLLAMTLTTANFITRLLFLGAALLSSTAHAASAAITHELDRKIVVMSDATGSLGLRLNYDGRCLLDQVTVRGKEAVAPDSGVGNAMQYPFPTYENGDLFLAWGELGTRAYAAYQPAVAFKYMRNVLAQYAKESLAFQRYLRKSQTCAGNDILANNCSIIVGLYRNLCGVQPKLNRLYLEPHLPAELAGTQLKYQLRGQSGLITPHTNGCRVGVDGVVVQDTEPFTVNVTRAAVEYFSGDRKPPSLSVARKVGETLEVRIETPPTGGDGTRKWIESGASGTRHVVADLRLNAEYALYLYDATGKKLRSDSYGRISFEPAASGATPLTMELRPQ